MINSVCKQAMHRHLEVISRAIPEDRHGVLVMDQAPWHRSLVVPDNITILHLPSYSPELNPHENIWEYLKNNFLSNRIYKDLGQITDACCEAWNSLCNEPGRIASIGSRKWADIN